MVKAGTIHQYRLRFHWGSGKDFDGEGVGGVILSGRCRAHFGLWVHLWEGFVLLGNGTVLHGGVLDPGFT